MAGLAAGVNAGSADRISVCIRGFERLLDFVPSSHPLRTEIAAMLGVAHGHIYNLASDPTDLDAAVAILESTVATPGIADSNRAFQYLFLAEALEKRYDRFHNPRDLDEAIRARERSLSLTEPQDADRAERAYRLGKLLLARATLSQQLADLDASVEMLKMACSAPSDDANRATWFHAPDTATPARTSTVIGMTSTPNAASFTCTPDVALSLSAAEEAVLGRAVVRHLFDITRTMYDSFAFVHEARDASRTYLEWKGRFHGNPVSGATILSYSENGLISEIQLYHRPYGQVLAFAAELAKRLAQP